MTVGEFYYQIGLKFPEKIHGIVPACGGKEVPFRNCNGEWLHYLFYFLLYTTTFTCKLNY